MSHQVLFGTVYFSALFRGVFLATCQVRELRHMLRLSLGNQEECQRLQVHPCLKHNQICVFFCRKIPPKNEHHIRVGKGWWFTNLKKNLKQLEFEFPSSRFLIGFIMGDAWPAERVGWLQSCAMSSRSPHATCTSVRWWSDTQRWWSHESLLATEG